MYENNDQLIVDLMQGLKMVFETKIPENAPVSTKLRIAQEASNHWLGKMRMNMKYSESTKLLAERMNHEND